MVSSKDISKLQTKLKSKLSASRYQHTLGVAYTCSCLAMKYEEDYTQALIAGLLHDCAKYMSDEEMLDSAKKAKIDISDVEQKMPALLHAKLGAYFAKKKYNVDDELILDAIACHTTGKPAMNTLEKILYISDYIEPGRNKMPRLAEIRKAAFEDLDICLKMILSDTVEYLKNNKSFIDDTTLDTYEYYCK